MATTTVSSEQVVRDCIAWLNGDASKSEAVSESVEVSSPLDNEYLKTRDEWVANLRHLRRGFPDIHHSIEELVAGDDVVMVELAASGTHDGEFMGIPPTGRQVNISIMNKYTVTDGRVVAVRGYFNPQEITEQLGLTFPAIIGQLPKLVWRKIRVRF